MNQLKHSKFNRGDFSWEIWIDDSNRMVRYRNSDRIDIDIEYYYDYQIRRLHHAKYDERLVSIADTSLCYQIMKGSM